MKKFSGELVSHSQDIQMYQDSQILWNQASKDFEDDDYTDLQSVDKMLRLSTKAADFCANAVTGNHKKISSQGFNDRTLSRFKEYERVKKERLVRQKEEILRKELENYTLTPNINLKKKKKLTKEPLLNRLDQILEARKQKIEDLGEIHAQKELNAELRECTFTPNVHRGGPRRSIDDLFNWNKEKHNRIVNKKLKEEEINATSEYTFTPKISKKSRALVEKRMEEDTNCCKKVEDRLLRYITKEKVSQDRSKSRGQTPKKSARGSLNNRKPKRSLSRSLSRSIDMKEAISISICASEINLQPVKMKPIEFHQSDVCPPLFRADESPKLQFKQREVEKEQARVVPEIPLPSDAGRDSSSVVKKKRASRSMRKAKARDNSVVKSACFVQHIPIPKPDKKAINHHYSKRGRSKNMKRVIERNMDSTLGTSGMINGLKKVNAKLRNMHTMASKENVSPSLASNIDKSYIENSTKDTIGDNVFVQSFMNVKKQDFFASSESINPFIVNYDKLSALEVDSVLKNC